MKINERISRINNVLRDYFAKHPQSGMILAKEFMPLFIENGIFNKDNREGLPIRKVLRNLDAENSLDKIPYVHAERKPKTTNWYFRHLFLSLVIFMGMLSSCSFKSNTDFPKVTHVAFQKEKYGKWGMVGVDGNILFENKFDKRPSFTVNGVFRIRDYLLQNFSSPIYRRPQLLILLVFFNSTSLLV